MGGPFSPEASWYGVVRGIRGIIWSVRLAILFPIAVVFLSCAPSEGDEGEACYGNGTCNSGLVCLSDLCVDLGDLPDADVPDAPVDAPQFDAVPQFDADPPFQCNNDSEIEPNDNINTATPTPIPDIQDFYNLANLAICPDSDIDVFRFRVDEVGKNAVADLYHDSSRGLLQLDILNATGTSIANGVEVMSDSDHLRAAINNLPAGIYYVQVRASNVGIENNYDTLDIVTSGP